MSRFVTAKINQCCGCIKSILISYATLAIIQRVFRMLQWHARFSKKMYGSSYPELFSMSSYPCPELAPLTVEHAVKTNLRTGILQLSQYTKFVICEITCSIKSDSGRIQREETNQEESNSILRNYKLYLVCKICCL